MFYLLARWKEKRYKEKKRKEKERVVDGHRALSYKDVTWVR